MSQDLKVQPALLLPRNIVNNIQPVYNVNPDKVGFIISQSASTSSFTTILTTSNKRRTFLDGVFMQIESDAVANNTSFDFTFTTVDNVARSIKLRKITLTEFSDSVFIPFKEPIELQKGSDIQFGSVFASGVSVMSVVTTGYEVDPQ